MTTTGVKTEGVKVCDHRILIIFLILATILLLTSPVTAQPENVELVLSGDGSIPFRIGDVKPGFHGEGYNDVTNNGTIDCTLFIWADNITGSYDLGKYMYFDVKGSRLTTNIDLPATIYDFPESPDDSKFIAVTPLKAGETVRLFWTWQFKETYTPQNEAQGKQLAFEILYTLHCPPPCLPPVANFTATPRSGTTPLTVQFSDRSSGNPTSWEWDFGDGTTSALKNPSHKYQNPGTYTVTLIARNSCGPSDPEVKLNFILVSGIPPTTPPTTKPTTSPTTCPTTCPTTKPTTSPTTCPTLCPTTKPTTSPTTCPTLCPTTKPTTSPTTCPLPLSDFVANRTAGSAPLQIQFTDHSTGDPTSWLWNFGDGTISDVQNPVHVYRCPGCYSVSLTTGNTCGNHQAQKIHFICVGQGPPVADFEANRTNGVAPLTVRFYDTSLGNPEMWLWNFGDGTTSPLQNPFYTYPNPGCYPVSLTVTNPSGSDTEQKQSYICVQDVSPVSTPVAAFQADVVYGTVPLTVLFSDRSTGSPESWLWDFGDGYSSAEQNPAHEFRSPGCHTVSLTVSNSYGSDTEQKINYICVQSPPSGSPPVANFQAIVTSGTAPLIVKFSDQSSGNPTSWTWDFGDNTTSIEKDPVHPYSLPGTYTVTLTVANPFGTDTVTRLNFISVIEPASLAVDFTGSPTSGLGPLVVRFTDLSSDNPTEWHWKFGDGTTSDLQNPTHRYNPGVYTVTLNASNSKGSATSVKTNYIFVYSSGGAGTGGGGGGGGGGGYTSSVPPMTSAVPSPTPIGTMSPSSCDLPVGPDNKAEKPFIISSPDGHSSLSVDEDTLLTCNNQSLECIFLIPIPPASLAPVPNTTEYIYTGYSYAIRPDCLIMDQNAIFSVTPSQDDWKLLGETELSLWWWDSAKTEWRKLPSTIDRDTRIVSTGVLNGGTYALFRATTLEIRPSVTPEPPEPPGNHRVIMILALILLSGSLALHFGGMKRKQSLSDSALILWAIGTIVMILGILYQIFFITGIEGPHLSTVHSPIGVISLIVTISGLAAWVKIRKRHRITPGESLNWLLITGIVLYIMTILLVFMNG